MVGLLLGLCLFLSASICTGATLKKVIVVARHGNRAPNAPVPYLCPNMKPQLEEFHEPIFSKYGAALSRVGLAENWESGNYLREKYGYLLPEGSYVNDGSSFFFAERMDRNVASLLSLIQGLFPEGTGQPGYLRSRPNIVPIMTTMHKLDTLMNLPRDGPCKPTYQRDRKRWEAEHIPTLRRKQHALLSKISAACGTDLTEVKKPLTWAIKNVADAFSFARNEGLEAILEFIFTRSMHFENGFTEHGYSERLGAQRKYCGRVQVDFDINATLSHETIQEFIDLSHQLVTEELFGRDEQVTYWMGRMPEVLLRLARKPSTQDSTASALYWPIGLKMPSEASPHEPWEMTAEEYWGRLKIGVFLNHRELMMALAKMLQIDDVVKQDLPAGSMFIFEVYSDEDSDESSMKMKFWRPTQPTPQEKYRGGYVDGDLLDHYGLGSATEIRPKICEGKAKCMWSDYRYDDTE